MLIQTNCMKLTLLKNFVGSVICFLICGLPTVNGQDFTFPPDFDPTDIPLMVMERMGVDFEAEGINVDELREVLRERMAERIASGGGGIPFFLNGNPKKIESPKPPVFSNTSILDKLRAKLEIQDEAEWRIVKVRIEAILKAKRDASSGEMDMMSLMFSGNKISGRQGILAKGSSKSKERKMLQRAIDSNSNQTELKQAIEVYNQMRQRKIKNLQNAQNELREILTPRQEAIATLIGIL